MEGEGPQRRLFLALWPDEEQRRQLVGMQERVTDQGGRPVGASNLHVTIAFLGNVAASREEELQRIAADWSRLQADLAFTRFAHWPKARLICLEAPEPPRVFLDAVSRLHEELRAAGFAVEDRPFRAHVTLIRNVARLDKPVGLPAIHHPFIWPVGSLSLVASTPAPGGSIYSVLSV